MTRNVLLTMAAVLTFMFVLPEDASAQYSYSPRPRRFGYRHRPHGYIGGQLMGLAVANQTSSEFSYLGQGGGGGLFGGFRFSPFFAIEGNWGVSYHGAQFDRPAYSDAVDAFYVMTFTADAKVFIPTFGPLEPYFQAGIGYAYTGATWGDGYGNDASAVWASGPTFSLGGGLDFYLGPNVAIGGRLLYRGFYFTPTDGAWGTGNNPDSNFISGVSLDINVSVHF